MIARRCCLRSCPSILNIFSKNEIFANFRTADFFRKSKKFHFRNIITPSASSIFWRSFWYINRLHIFYSSRVIGTTNFVKKWNFEALEFNLKDLKSRKKEHHNRFQRVKLPWGPFFIDLGIFFFKVHTCLNVRLKWKLHEPNIILLPLYGIFLTSIYCMWPLMSWKTIDHVI